jgi:hypothetical protein
MLLAAGMGGLGFGGADVPGFYKMPSEDLQIMFW